MGNPLRGAASLLRIVVAGVTSVLSSGCGTVPMLPERAMTSALQPHSDSPLMRTVRLRFAIDGVSLEWLAASDAGDVVLTQEPEATLLMHLHNVLFGPFVPEQLL